MGRKMLTATSESAGTTNSTLSLIASAPCGMVTDEFPVNVTARFDPNTIAAPTLRIPTCTAATVSGCVPNAFDSRTRSRSPPRLEWTIIRKLWSLKSLRKNPVCGLALQLPTHRPFRPDSSSPARAGVAKLALEKAASVQITMNCTHRTFALAAGCKGGMNIWLLLFR